MSCAMCDHLGPEISSWTPPVILAQCELCGAHYVIDPSPYYAPETPETEIKEPSNEPDYPR